MFHVTVALSIRCSALNPCFSLSVLTDLGDGGLLILHGDASEDELSG